jgi:hypothetical protein
VSPDGASQFQCPGWQGRLRYAQTALFLGGSLPGTQHEEDATGFTKLTASADTLDLAIDLLVFSVDRNIAFSLGTGCVRAASRRPIFGRAGSDR